jgi:hypothetical protein
MKTPRVRVLCLFIALFGLLASCSKPDQGTSAPQVEVKKSPDVTAPAAPDIKADAQKIASDAAAQATNVQPAVQKAAEDGQAQADQLTAKNQSLLDSAKQMLADNKPADALKVLNDLAAAKLTPAQQSTLKSLTEQAQALLQKLATSDAGQKASEAVGGLLKKP